MIPHSRPTIDAEDFRAVEAALTRGMLAEGDLAGRLTERLSTLVGGAGGAACGSGTQALVLALRAAGMGPGSRVALPTYVCPEVPAAVLYAGGEPFFCDIGEDLLLAPDKALRAAKICDVLVIPYVLGRWRDFSHVCSLRAVIIEDFAQFVHPTGQGFPGMQGDFAVFSLHATKVLCSGEGGVVVAADVAGVEALKEFKRIGDSPYVFNMFPLSDLQAALGLAQLDRLDGFLTQRKESAAEYFRLIAELPGISCPPAAFSMHFRFPVTLPGSLNAQAVISDFARLGVTVRRPVDTLSHRIVPGAANGVNDDDFPVARQTWERTISLPIYPELSAQEKAFVAATARTVLNQSAGEQESVREEPGHG